MNEAYPNGYRITHTPRRASLYYSAQTEKIPPGMPKRERKIRFRVVFFCTLGMVIIYSIMALWVFIIQPTLTNLEDQWHAGDQRLSTVAGDVGHGGKSLFISFEGQNNQVIVIECVGNKYKVYTGPLISANSPHVLVTVELSDVNGDGKLDAIVHIQGSGSEFALINTGDGFAWQK